MQRRERKSKYQPRPLFNYKKREQVTIATRNKLFLERIWQICNLSLLITTQAPCLGLNHSSTCANSKNKHRVKFIRRYIFFDNYSLMHSHSCIAKRDT